MRIYSCFHTVFAEPNERKAVLAEDDDGAEPTATATQLNGAETNHSNGTSNKDSTSNGFASAAPAAAHKPLKDGPPVVKARSRLAHIDSANVDHTIQPRSASSQHSANGSTHSASAPRPADGAANGHTAVDVGKHGMVLPFDPITLTFRDVHYYVPKPGAGSGQELELLQGISGAFRPGVLTALMGASGAGKTTFMDVLAGQLQNTACCSLAWQGWHETELGVHVSFITRLLWSALPSSLMH